MATVELTIAGRRHELACRDGEEAHLRMIAAMVDAKAKAAARSMGGMSEARQMLFVALMMADELNDARIAADRLAATPPPPPEPDPAITDVVEWLAGRLEQLSALIDESAPPPAADAAPETPAGDESDAAPGTRVETLPDNA